MKIRSLMLAAAAGASLLGVAEARAEFLGVAASHGFVEIEGYGSARVIRLYACFTDADDQLLTVYGNEPYPLEITAGQTPFYQDDAGSDTGAPSTVFYPFVCGLRYDTFVDIGRVAGDTGETLVVSPGFVIGATALATDNGLWGRLPDDPLNRAGSDGKVFFGQFTVPADAPLLTGVAVFGVVEGGINANEFGVTFSEAGAVPIPQNPDVDGNQAVDASDLLETIAAWGVCESCPGGCDDCFCYADSNEDGEVGVDDIIAVIMQWNQL